MNEQKVKMGRRGEFYCGLTAEDRAISLRVYPRGTGQYFLISVAEARDAYLMRTRVKKAAEGAA